MLGVCVGCVCQLGVCWVCAGCVLGRRVFGVFSVCWVCVCLECVGCVCV